MATLNDSKECFLNLNIGVLGHVDSGKTSLSKSLSTVASTAAFDKNPQSKERGITLDLGFSSFLVNCPDHLKDNNYEKLQFTLVDCPGHASLIKTILGGAQIIDMMLLVIDVVKGMQTQTAECLIIGEILCEKMIVVINKIDLISEDKRSSVVQKMKTRLLKTLENTKFKNAPVVAVAAKFGETDSERPETIGLDDLIACLKSQSYIPNRNPTGSFLLAVDHCFSIRGQGTVMTGTVLNGSIAVNDNVEIPALKEIKKVKSLQMFRQPVKKAFQGDRVGVCVTQFDPKNLERGFVCSPGTLPTLFGAILSVNKISYFKGSCTNKSKFHITVGYETVMAKMQFFNISHLNFDVVNDSIFNFNCEYSFQEELSENKSSGAQFVLLEFERPIICQKDALVIASKLDIDINVNTCRIAFYGKIVYPFTLKDFKETLLPNLKVYKMKQKEGVIERMMDDYTVIARSIFKKETRLELFDNMKVTLSTGETGRIDGRFGQSGKIKINIPNGLGTLTKEKLSIKKKGKQQLTADVNSDSVELIKVSLCFKKYIYDSTNKMIQN
ncbi:selenocysteine-specific elongation factor [Hydra vulgaris]|uniref:selenocysteine-specific elongation factor n=1 Tax=Hydra vulgaris TaxID=6087 RepID=UPI001F5F67B7|nr:selenocysteine-specific elongation factor [Hydra vulgaris]